VPPTATNTPLPPTATATTTPVPPTATNTPSTLPPDIQAKGDEAEVFCPTDNERAGQAYNDAIELEQRSQIEQAKQMYLKAIDLDPNYCDAMDNLGRLLRRQGKVAEAIEWYKRSVQVLPTNAVAHQNLGFAYRIQGKMSEATAEYELLTQIHPKNPEGYYGLGQIALDTRQLSKAIMYFKRAEELYAEESSPFITDARYNLGITYYMLGECIKAIDYLNLVYPELSDHPKTNYVLGLSYLCPESTDVELARRYLKKAQELGVEIPADVLGKLK
jgi:tetratricopeptide (TPR) repeat protein